MAFYCRKRDLNEVKYVLRDQGHKLTDLAKLLGMLAQQGVGPHDSCNSERSIPLPPENEIYTEHTEKDLFERTVSQSHSTSAREHQLKKQLQLAGTLLYKLVSESRQLDSDRQRLIQKNLELTDRMNVLERMAVLSGSSMLSPHQMLSSTQQLPSDRRTAGPYRKTLQRPQNPYGYPEATPLNVPSNDSVWDLLIDPGK